MEQPSLSADLRISSEGRMQDKCVSDKLGVRKGDNDADDTFGVYGGGGSTGTVHQMLD
jgi:hypothetical protein